MYFHPAGYLRQSIKLLTSFIYLLMQVKPIEVRTLIVSVANRTIMYSTIRLNNSSKFGASLHLGIL